MMKKLIISLLFMLGCFTSNAIAETPAIFANISNTDGVSVMTNKEMSNVSAMAQYELNYITILIYMLLYNLVCMLY